MQTVIIFHCIFPLLITLNYPILSSEISQKIFKKEFYILQCNYLWRISRQTSFENNQGNISNNVTIRHFITTDYICGTEFGWGQCVPFRRLLWTITYSSQHPPPPPKVDIILVICNLSAAKFGIHCTCILSARCNWISLVYWIFQHSKAISSWKLCCVT